jgi:hypothetical protein
MSHNNACNACDAAGSRSKCSNCKTPYCSASCQKADWPSHKALCNAICNALSDIRAGALSKECHACSTPLSTEQAIIQNCTACRFATYCGVACQAAHWPEHGRICERVGKAVFTSTLERAEKGDSISMCNAGMLYEHGHAGAPNDLIEAVKWYSRSALLGDTTAMYSLGLCIQAGKGVDKDDEEAFKWLLRAANHGHVQAQYSVGKCFHHGRGVDANPDNAFKYYIRSGLARYPRAQVAVALCFFQGIGVPVNIEVGESWMSRAALNGDELAQKTLRLLC